MQKGALKNSILFIPLLVFVAIVFTTSTSFGQCLKSFQISAGGNSDDIAYDVADAGNGQFFVAGTTTSFGAGAMDILVTKMSATGSIIWTKTYGGSGNELVRKISATPDSGLVVIGQTTSYDSQGDIFCMKIDAKGNLIWSRKFGVSSDPNGDLGLDIIQTTDGGYAFVGIFNVAGSIANLDVTRLDANANVVWCKRLFDQQASDGTGIIQNGNSLIVTTDLDHNGVNYSSLIMQYNIADGSIVTQKELVPPSRGLFQPYLRKDLAGNGYWISGQTIDGNSYAAMQPTILHLDNSFNIINTYSYKVPSVYTNDYYTGFAQMSNGFLACASTSVSPTTGYLFYINNNGITWAKNFIGKSDRSLYKVQQIGSQIITVGRDNSSGKANDFFVSGFNQDGFIDSLCHPDTALVTITNPAFTENDFNWYSITDQTFADISAPITVSAVSLTAQSLCDACPVPVVTPAFTIPDTVCVNSPVAIKNTTVGAISYYWSFCTADITQPPTGTNLGNVSGVLNTPVFIDYATQNGNYYAFSTNFATGELVRLDFGTSMLNAPTATDLGSFGGILPYATTEGIQVVQNNGNWYALIVGGTPANGTAPKIVKIAFGTSLTNPSPVATDWGNIGNLDLPHDLYVFQQGANWYGFTINKNNNTVTRFDFGSSFENVPTATNLGTFAGFNMPTGIFASNDNGQWHVFVVNSYDGPNPDVTAGTITRIDFGTSLLNTSPTSVNLGNIGNAFHNPRDIYIIKYCGANVGFVVNHATNDIVRLDFPGDLSTTPTATSLGNIGNLDFPHSISKLFRVGADIYALIPNAASSTITRIKFSGCNSSSTPSSTAQNPPAVTYSTPGVYNINLAIDDGLATQNSLCQQVVVLAPPTINVNNDTSVCSGDSVHLLASGAASYQWSPAATLSNPNIPNPVATPVDSTRYFVTGKNTFGCAAKDSVTIKILQHPTIKTIPDTSICSGATIQLTTTAVNGGTYSWLPSAGLSDPTVLSPAASPVNTTTYTIDVTGKNGCTNKDSVKVTVVHQATVKSIGDTSICGGTTIQLSTTVVNGSTYNWLPTTALSNPAVSSPFASPTASTQYVITVNGGSQCAAKDTVNITVNPSPLLTMSADTAICAGSTVQLTASSAGSPVYSWSPSGSLTNPAINNPVASPNATTTYYVQVTDKNNCKAADSVTVTVTPVPTIATLSDTTIVLCKNSTIQLTTTVTNGSKYSWSPATGLSDANALSPYATPLVDTKYTITASNGKCFATDSVSITVKPSPSVAASGDTVICAGSTVQLSSIASPGVTYSWLPVTGLSNPSSPNPSAKPLSSTVYVVQVAYSNGCVAEDSVNIKVNPQPSVSTLPDTAICAGSTIQLTTTVVNANTYNWSPAAGLSSASAISPFASPTSTTRYIVTANPGGLCTAKDSVTVTVNPSPSVAVSADATICSGTSTQLTATSPGNVTFSWSPNAGLSDSSVYNPVASPSATTKYLVTVTLNGQCSANDSVTVNVLPQPTVKSIPDTVICAGSTIQLTTIVVNANSYSWSPATGLSSASAISPLASPTSTTQYIVTANPGGLCTAKDSVTVTVNPSPSVAVSGDATICSGTSTQLTAISPGNVVYSWSPNAGLSDSSVYNPVASPTATTKYFITVTLNGQCSTNDSVTVNVLPQPTVKSIPDTAICSGTTIQLATTAVNGSSYSWSPATGLSSPTSLSPSANPKASVQYIITVNPGSQCTAMDTVNVTVNPLPLVTTSADTLICTGGSGQLLASSPDNVTYNWLPVTGLSSPSIPNPVATPSSTTSYNVTVTDSNFCATSATVVVTVNPQPVFGITPATASICIGDTVTVTASGGDIYSWSPTSGVTDPTAPSTVLSPQATTNYQVSITNSTCKVTDTVQALITVSTKPVVTISKSNDLDCFVGQATLQATGGSQYTWSPAANLNNPYSASPVASPFATTTYYVQVSKGAGCVAEDSIQLKVLTNDENGYNVPSAFTPNGDGHNDCFGVKLWGGIKSIDFSVYNRWGQRIFHTNNPGDCWDGTYNGQQQPPGAFVYQIQANTTCGAVYRKGTVVLVR